MPATAVNSTIITPETTYTYRPSDAVAVRTSHGDDARAGRLPWHCGLGEVLPGTLGLRVVQFLPIRPHRRTRLLRPGSTVSAVADQRGGLAQSSWARRLARVAGHHPQPPGSRFAYAPWSLHLTKLTNPAGVELRVLTLLPTRRATAPRPFGKPALRSACGPSVGERNGCRSRQGGFMTPPESGAFPGR